MDEINLRQTLAVLIKKRYVLFVIIVLAMIAGVLLHTFIPNKYTAQTTVLANPIRNIASPYGEKFFNFPNMDIMTFMDQFLNSYTIANTIDELDLRVGGSPMTHGELARMVTVTNPLYTNLIHVSVTTNGNPYQAALVSEALSRHFINHITNIYKASAANAVNTVAERMAAEERNLDAAAMRLRDHLVSSANMEIIRAEVEMLLEQVTEFKREYNELDLADADTQSARSALETAIADMEARINGLMVVLAEEQYRYDDVLRRFNNAEAIYSRYVEQYNEARIIETANFGNMHISIIAEPAIPSSPSNKNLALTLIIAFLAGAAIGIIGILTLYYWSLDDDRPRKARRVRFLSAEWFYGNFMRLRRSISKKHTVNINDDTDEDDIEDMEARETVGGADKKEPRT
jgi:uncharacterized protein involved in exopolysaccharide biosynthesis